MNMNENVKQGAKMLDRFKPGWFELIDTSELAMQVCSLCILGQLFGEYDYGCALLNLDPEEGFEYGFNLETHGWDDPVWLNLAQAWIVEVQRRQGEDYEFEGFDCVNCGLLTGEQVDEITDPFLGVVFICRKCTCTTQLKWRPISIPKKEAPK